MSGSTLWCVACGRGDQANLVRHSKRLVQRILSCGDNTRNWLFDHTADATLLPPYQIELVVLVQEWYSSHAAL
jgi:hypothetical protein